MIRSFLHKGLKQFFINNNRRFLESNLCDRISRILDRLDVVEFIEDMRLPGYGLHKLSGNRKDTWSIKVSGNWRITFRFDSQGAYDVNLEDYH